MRLLKSNEAELIKALLMTNHKLAEAFIQTIDTALVEDMDDGGMGSLLFISDTDLKRTLGKTVAEAEFMDEDGIPVSVELSLDNHSQLFELDVWKVDSSPLSKFPDIKKVIIK